MLLNDSLENIASGCFANTGLKEITIPRAAAQIKCSAFEGCHSLKCVRFAGDALKSIEASAFQLSGLEEFTAPP